MKKIAKGYLLLLTDALLLLGLFSIPVGCSNAERIPLVRMEASSSYRPAAFLPEGLAEGADVAVEGEIVSIVPVKQNQVDPRPSTSTTDGGVEALPVVYASIIIEPDKWFGKPGSTELVTVYYESSGRIVDENGRTLEVVDDSSPDLRVGDRVLVFLFEKDFFAVGLKKGEYWTTGRHMFTVSKGVADRACALAKDGAASDGSSTDFPKDQYSVDELESALVRAGKAAAAVALGAKDTDQ